LRFWWSGNKKSKFRVSKKREGEKRKKGKKRRGKRRKRSSREDSIDQVILINCEFHDLMTLAR
jgi:hypothetical protein